MDYNQTPDTPGQISKYNDAVGSMMRLNNHWISAEYYANSGQLTKWKFKLDSVWRELFTDVIQIGKGKKELAKEIIKENAFHKFKIGNVKNRNKLYSYLEDRHNFLRSIQDKAGKAGVYVDEDTESFE